MLVEQYGFAQKRADILEGDGGWMKFMQRFERLQRRGDGTGKADSLEIGIEIDLFGHRPPLSLFPRPHYMSKGQAFVTGGSFSARRHSRESGNPLHRNRDSLDAPGLTGAATHEGERVEA